MLPRTRMTTGIEPGQTQRRRSVARAVAERLGDRNIAVWQGNYYAVEVMKRLGLDEGAVRAGIVHYDTADEVNRLLSELSAV